MGFFKHSALYPPIDLNPSFSLADATGGTIPENAVVPGDRSGILDQAKSPERESAAWEQIMGLRSSVSVRATHLASDLLICRRYSDERRAVIGQEVAEP